MGGRTQHDVMHTEINNQQKPNANNVTNTGALQLRGELRKQ